MFYQGIPHVYISSDASNDAVAACYVLGETQNISFKNLSPDEAVQSSTW